MNAYIQPAKVCALCRVIKPSRDKIELLLVASLAAPFTGRERTRANRNPSTTLGPLAALDPVTTWPICSHVTVVCPRLISRLRRYQRGGGRGEGEEVFFECTHKRGPTDIACCCLVLLQFPIRRIIGRFPTAYTSFARK